MVVDDHQLVLDGIKAIISSEPRFDLIGDANNGKEALRFLEHLKVDIALLDIDMPEMNGIDATRIIKKEYSNCKVIILTMHDEPGMIKELMAIGADGYILKNSDKEEMIKAVLTVAEGGNYFSGDVMEAMERPVQVATDKNTGIITELTNRELEILQLVAKGLSNKEIGEELFISHRTVDTHRTNLMKKIEVHNVAGLIRFAMDHGLVE